MIFIKNKYFSIYFSIIKNAKNRNLKTRKEAKKVLDYVERHHIIPTSLSGTNSHDNLVFLTAREHFICHKLLIRFTHGIYRNKMIYALSKMMCVSNSHKRCIYTSKDYEYVRKMITGISGESHHNYNKKRSDEWKRKRSELYSGTGNPTYGKRWKVKQWNGNNAGENNPMHGKNQTKQTKEKQSIKAKTRVKASCLKCRVCCDISNFTRWHGDNCGNRP